MSEQAKKKFRVTNTTHLISPPNGFMLDFESKLFAPGRTPIIVEDTCVPEKIEKWQTDGWVRVTDAVSGEVYGMDAATQPIVTAGSRVKEANQEDFDDEIGFDPTVAREAALSVGAHSPSISQMPEEQSRARVSLGSENEDHVADSMSPIPGDRPRSVDDSDQFTVKAPRNTSTGGVISGR